MKIKTGFLTVLVMLCGGALFAAQMGKLPALKYDRNKAELGKRLFFDERLSGDASISCAS